MGEDLGESGIRYCIYLLLSGTSWNNQISTCIPDLYAWNCDKMYNKLT